MPPVIPPVNALHPPVYNPLKSASQKSSTAINLFPNSPAKPEATPEAKPVANPVPTAEVLPINPAPNVPAPVIATFIPAPTPAPSAPGNAPTPKYLATSHPTSILSTLAVWVCKEKGLVDPLQFYGYRIVLMIVLAEMQLTMRVQQV